MMPARVPILGEHHVLERFGQLIDDRDDLLAPRNGEPPAGAEIVLDVDHQQDIFAADGRLLQHDGSLPDYSVNVTSLRASTGWRSFSSALASICRMRSRVTPNTLPTSSSVWSPAPSMPKRMRRMRCSRGDSSASASVRHR